MKNQDFTEKELNFIIDSLNETLNNAEKKLDTKSLGELERAFIKETAQKAKELLAKMTA